MKRNLNRGISILLSVCMVLSILAGSGVSLVRAESATKTETVVSLPNLIANGTFGEVRNVSTYTINAIKYLKSWSGSSFKNMTVEATDAYVLNGQYYASDDYVLHITHEASKAAASIYQTVTLPEDRTENSTIKLSAFACGMFANKAYMYIQFLDNDGGKLSKGENVEFATSSVWEEYNSEMTIPKDAASAQVYITTKASTEFDGYVDNMSLTVDNGENLLSNSSFEEILTGATLEETEQLCMDKSDWTEKVSSTIIANDEGDNAYLHLAGDAAEKAWGAVNSIDVEPDTEYQLTFDYKSDADVLFYFAKEFEKDAEDYIKNPFKRLSVAETWTAAPAITFTTGSNTVRLEMYPYFAAVENGTVARNAYFDNFVLTKVCDHEWVETGVNGEGNCQSPLVSTFECAACGAVQTNTTTYDHDYVDGICASCGDVCEHNAPEGYCVNCGLEMPAHIIEEELFSNGALQSGVVNAVSYPITDDYQLGGEGWYIGGNHDEGLALEVTNQWASDGDWAFKITDEIEGKLISINIEVPVTPGEADKTVYLSADVFSAEGTTKMQVAPYVDDVKTGDTIVSSTFATGKTASRSGTISGAVNKLLVRVTSYDGISQAIFDNLVLTLDGGENLLADKNGSFESLPVGVAPVETTGTVQFNYNGYDESAQTSGWVSPKEMSEIAEGTKAYAAFDWEEGNATNAVLHVYDKAVKAESPNSASIVYRLYKLEKDTKYTLKFDAKMVGTNIPLIYAGTSTSAANKTQLESPTTTPAANGWTTYEYEFTTPADEFSMIIIQIATNSSLADYDSWYDNFSLFKTCAHEWKNPVVSDANCTNKATRTVTCDCGAVGVTEYGAVSENHTLVDATCTTPSYCTVPGCGYIAEEALDHDCAHIALGETGLCARCGKEITHKWTNDEGESTNGVCDRCGLGCEHVYDADCDAECNICGVIREDVADHVYFYPCDPVCMNCYEITNPDAAHTIVAVEAKEATCIANGNVAYWCCDDCGAAWTDEALTQMTNLKSVIIPATGEHTYVDGVCSGCGATAGPIADANLTFLGTAGISFQDYIGMNIMFYNGTAANYDKFYAIATQVDPAGNAVETLCNVVPYSYAGYDYTIFEHPVMSWSMTEQVTLTLYAEKDGVVYVGQSIVTSVHALALEKLATFAAANNTVNCAALVDMLNYGAAVQVNQDHFVESLPSAGDYASYGTTTTPEFNATSSVTGSGIVGYGPSISMQAKVEFNVMYYGADLEGKTVKAFVNGEEVEVLYNYDAAPGWPIARVVIKANQMRSTFTIAVYDADGNIVSQVIETSIEACAQTHLGGANNDLVIALMRYGDSVSKVG